MLAVCKYILENVKLKQYGEYLVRFAIKINTSAELYGSTGKVQLAGHVTSAGFSNNVVIIFIIEQILGVVTQNPRCSVEPYPGTINL